MVIFEAVSYQKNTGFTGRIIVAVFFPRESGRHRRQPRKLRKIGIDAEPDRVLHK
jgi:hypothetical protein